MKKIGILGGIGWPSTVEYYQIISQKCQSYYSSKNISGPLPTPEISIESLNMNFSFNNRGSSELGSWDLWDAYFNDALKRLENNGVDIIVIASVTPHSRLTEISKGISVPIISVYEAIGAECKKQKIKRMLVLGTMPTMSTPAFINGMRVFGVEAYYPPTNELKEAVVNIIQRLYENKTQDAAQEINELVLSCVSEMGFSNTAVCLGCTELPLAFSGFSDNASFSVEGYLYLNSTVIHAGNAFLECIE